MAYIFTMDTLEGDGHTAMNGIEIVQLDEILKNIS